MGSGKTTVGKIIAERLSREFIDTDSLIEEATGIPIVRLFSERSEAYFRSLEKDVISSITSRRSLVIATGGGMAACDENFRMLDDHGVLICLCASTDTILARLNGSNSRPLLNGGNMREKVEAILEKRKAYWDRMKYRISTDDLSVDQVAGQVLDIFSKLSEDD